MKKNNLFKAVGIVILLYVLVSWIAPILYSIAGWKGEVESISGGEPISVSQQIGLTSILSVVLETFSGFGSVILFILLVGAFYGVLKKTGTYDKVLDLLANKANGKETLTLILTIVVMALVSSIVGLDLGLIIVFPILMGLIVKIGYDKLVALSATLGATIVGMYGATFAGTLYGANTTILGIDKFSYIVPKVIFFVVGLAALIFFTLMYTKKNNILKNKATKSTSKAKATSKKSSVKETTKSKSKKVKKEFGALPALIVMGLLLLVMILGSTNWAGIFGSNWFETAHKSWTEFTVGGFAIFGKLFGGVDSFGTWFAPTRFQTYSLLLIIAMLAITLLYRIKISEAFEGFVDGIKSYIVPALLAVLACSVFVFVYYNPVLNVLTSGLLTKEFNIAFGGIYTIVNSVFYVDYYYLSYAVLYGLAGKYTDNNVLALISLMFVNLYSLVMLVAPTSVLLLVSLSISDVKYTEWLKFIWKLVLTLLLVSFVVFIILMLI